MKATEKILRAAEQYAKFRANFGTAINGFMAGAMWMTENQDTNTKKMSIEYKTCGHTFSMDYQNLKGHYESILKLSDEDFLKELPAILHLSCAICYIKGLSAESTIGDKGLIHELVHLLHIPDEPLISLEWVRELFKSICKLA